MRKVISYHLVSLDGIAQNPEVFTTEWDEAMNDNLAGIISSQDAVIMGRITYEEWSRYWPSSDVEPFGTFINGVNKYVVSSSLATSSMSWSNTRLVEGNLAPFVSALKTGVGGDIGVHASLSVTKSLIGFGLVDVMHLVVAPRIMGQGRRLFDGISSSSLKLTSSAVSPCGYWLSSYELQK